MLRGFIVRTCSSFLLVIPFMAAAILATEIYLRIAQPDYLSGSYQKCLLWTPGPFHVRYLPNCEATAIVEGETIVYRFNELGLRERAGSEFSEGAIVVLGDSNVKGMFVSEENTIPRLLRERLENDSVFNAGVRFTSPIQQYRLMKRLEKIVKVRGVLWFLNGTDIIDERLYAALAESRDVHGIPNRFSNADFDGVHPLLNGVYLALAGKSRLLDMIYVRHIQSIWTRLVRAVPPDSDLLCRTLKRGAAEFTGKGIPMTFVFTPHKPSGIEKVWDGLGYDPSELDRMVECANQTKARVVDLTKENVPDEYYFPDDLHFRAEGMKWVADKVAAAVSSKIFYK